MGVTLKVADELDAEFRRHLGERECVGLHTVGAVRRRDEKVDELAYVYSGSKPELVRHAIWMRRPGALTYPVWHLGFVVDSAVETGHGNKPMAFNAEFLSSAKWCAEPIRIGVSIKVCQENNLGAALVQETGPQEFVAWLYGGAPLPTRTCDDGLSLPRTAEEDEFNALGVDYVQPEDRRAFAKVVGSANVVLDHGWTSVTATTIPQHVNCRCAP